MRRLALGGHRRHVVVVCLDRVLLGRHYPTDVVGGLLLGRRHRRCSGWPSTARCRAAIAVASEPLPEAVPLATASSRSCSTRSRSRTSTQFRAIVDTMAAEAGWATPTWHYTTDRGPGHRHGGGGLGRRRRPGARLRRRRHGARGLRRARRHRHPGRDHPGRHRQPAGPQPRHPALPARRDRRRASTARTAPSTWSR